MNDESGLKINPIVAVVFIVQVVFVILAAMTILGLLEPEQPELKVNLTGLNQNIPELPENQKESIEFFINSALTNNNPGEVVLKNGINIRDGSVINKYYEDADMYYTNFIVDVPDFEQSYKVAQVWAGNTNNQYISKNINTAVTCLDKEDMIYPEFDCKNDDMYSAPTVLVSVMKAMSNKLENDENVTMVYEFDRENGDARVRLMWSKCGDSQCFCRKLTDADKERITNEFSDFLEGVGYSVNQIPYYFYNCENDTRVVDENGELVLQQ